MRRPGELTKQQRTYAEHRVAGEGIAEAARSTGSTAKEPGKLGSKWERTPKVKQYIDTLRANIARARRDGDPPGRIEDTKKVAYAAIRRVVEVGDRRVADSAEALAKITALMDANAPDFLRSDGSADIEAMKASPRGTIRRIRVKTAVQRVPGGDEYEELREISFEVADAGAMARALIDHYDGVKTAQMPQSQGVNVLAVLMALPTGATRRDAALALLQAGAGQEQHVIEDAVVVPGAK